MKGTSHDDRETGTTQTESNEMTDALRERLIAHVRESRTPTRRERRVHVGWMAAAGLTWLIGVSLALDDLAPGGSRQGSPTVLAVASAAGCALASLWASLGRGPSMLGRPRAVLVAAVLGVPLVLTLSKLALAVPGSAAQAEIGSCLLASMLAGIGPFLALAWVRHGTVLASPRWLGAALGVTAGALAWVMNEARCPSGAPVHVLAGHLFPLLAYALLGAAIGGWLKPRPVRPPSPR